MFGYAEIAQSYHIVLEDDQARIRFRKCITRARIECSIQVIIGKKVRETKSTFAIYHNFWLFPTYFFHTKKSAGSASKYTKQRFMCKYMRDDETGPEDV